MFLKSADLEKLLADEYKTLYNTKMQKAFIQRRVESREWVSPIMLSYEKSWSTAILALLAQGLDTLSVSTSLSLRVEVSTTV